MAEDLSPLRRIEGLEEDLGSLFHLKAVCGLMVGLKGGGLYSSHPYGSPKAFNGSWCCSEML